MFVDFGFDQIGVNVEQLEFVSKLLLSDCGGIKSSFEINTCLWFFANLAFSSSRRLAFSASICCFMGDFTGSSTCFFLLIKFEFFG